MAPRPKAPSSRIRPSDSSTCGDRRRPDRPARRRKPVAGGCGAGPVAIARGRSRPGPATERGDLERGSDAARPRTSTGARWLAHGAKLERPAGTSTPRCQILGQRAVDHFSRRASDESSGKARSARVCGKPNHLLLHLTARGDLGRWAEQYAGDFGSARARGVDARKKSRHPAASATPRFSSSFFLCASVPGVTQSERSSSISLVRA